MDSLPMCLLNKSMCMSQGAIFVSDKEKVSREGPVEVTSLASRLRRGGKTVRARSWEGWEEAVSSGQDVAAVLRRPQQLWSPHKMKAVSILAFQPISPTSN